MMNLKNCFLALAVLVAAMPFAAKAGTYDLTIAETTVNIIGQEQRALSINGGIPGPVLRFKEGEELVLNVTNKLDEDTSIHWHGLILPYDQDGVPGISYPGIKAKSTFTYRFPAQQSGTYWYHSHSGLQEQIGVYGAIIIEPKKRDPFRYDREYVVVLSDWHKDAPESILGNLKKQADYYNYQQRTVPGFFDDVKKMGFDAALADRMDWGDMRMTPTDIADVSGYTFLVNGKNPKQNWTGLFKAGERVRLRFINAAAMTYFDVRIPGLKMTVVQADGNNVQPVPVDEFRIAVAETYDVIVRPTENKAFTVFAESMARTGFARGTLAPEMGMKAAVPETRKPQILSMADMDMSNMEMGGMDHSKMAMGEKEAPKMAMPEKATPKMDHSKMAMGEKEAPKMAMPEKAMPKMDHSKMPMGEKEAPKMAMPEKAMPKMDHSKMAMGEKEAPKMAMPEKAMPKMDHSKMGMSKMPMDKMDMGKMDMGKMSQKPDPFYAAGSGLMPKAANGGKILSYADLKAFKPLYPPRKAGREIVIRLTGNMERYIWSINGTKYSDAQPIRLKKGERVRFKFINQTMMTHPMHLHGMWQILDNGNGKYNPAKHTLSIAPGTTVEADVEVDNAGQWAFHCHLMYHMATGMFRKVIVETETSSLTQ